MNELCCQACDSGKRCSTAADLNLLKVETPRGALTMWVCAEHEYLAYYLDGNHDIGDIDLEIMLNSFPSQLTEKAQAAIEAQIGRPFGEWLADFKGQQAEHEAGLRNDPTDIS